MNILKCAALLATFFFIIQTIKGQETTDVVIIHEYQDIPIEDTSLGEIKDGYNVFKTRCNCGIILKEVKGEAASKGANLIKITTMKFPDMSNTCYRVKADIFKVKDITPYKQYVEQWNDSVRKSLIPPDSQYALVYFFRPRFSSDLQVGYEVRMNDSISFIAMNVFSWYHIKVRKEGNVKFSIGTKSTAKFNVKFGNTYFVKCSMDMGMPLLHAPNLEILDFALGFQEFHHTFKSSKQEAKAKVGNIVY